MKVDVVTSLYPGPTRPYEGVFAERRWLGMRARGHEVRVIQPVPHTPYPVAFGKWREIGALPRRENRGGIEVLRPRYLHLPRRTLRNVERFVAKGLELIGATAAPDVVVADYAWPAGGVAPALRNRGIPCVVSGRGSDVLQVAGEAGLGEELGSFLRAAGHWCGVSQDLVDAMDGLGERPGRGKLVPNGVDTDTFTIRPRADAKRALELPPEAPLVLVAGHLIERKDPRLALETFAGSNTPDVQLAFVGRGELHDELVESVRAHGLEERVRFAGEVAPEQLVTWYAACDCLLLTSKREGRPNVVLEALACGRPVLATRVGGTGELLGGWNGRMLADTRHAGELAPMLDALLADPPPSEDLRRSVSELSWDASLDALEVCLEDAIGDAS